MRAFDPNAYDANAFQCGADTFTKDLTGNLDFTHHPVSLNLLKNLWTRAADAIGTIWTRLFYT